MPTWSRRREHVPDLTTVRLLPPQESPFGVSVLDCRPVTQNLVSTTASIDIAARFTSLRSSSGDLLDRIQLPHVLETPNGLRFPFDGAGQPNGPVFRARIMEEKWDLFVRGGRLFCLRSWTGDPVYAAQLVWTTGEWTIAEVSRAQGIDEDPSRSIQVVDYLVKSHLYNLAAPHPLKTTLRGDDQALAIASFSEFGWRALYGTFDDLLHSETLERSLWG